MTANQLDIQRLQTAGGGVILRRQHPELADALAYLVRLGRLRTVLPGVYAAADTADDLQTRTRAVTLWDPNAVLTGPAAARLTFWPELPVAEVEVAVKSKRFPQPGYTFCRRVVPPELTMTTRHRVRCSVPALTALDLCAPLGAEALDVVLRTRSSTVQGLYEALRLTPGRPGNGLRRGLLLESRGNAWSPAERNAQRLFIAEGLSGWVGNYPLPLLGQLYYLDFAFPEAKLAVEIDGRAYHSSREAFEADRWRQNDIILAGWRVLRFTAAMLEQHPQIVVAIIRRALQESTAR